MKKIVLTIIAAVSFTLGTKAQAPDLYFDAAWVADPAPATLTDPAGWTSFNTANLAGMAQTVYRDTPGYLATSAAAKVVTEKLPAAIMVPNPMRPGHNFDTVGLLCLGKITLAGTLTFGQPIANGRPAMLTFASKYTPVAGSGDSAYVLAYLTKWNLAEHRLDTVAHGKWAEGATTTSYSSHSITMIYDTAIVVPDSQQIFVSSSIYRGGSPTHAPAIGSAYYVDAFCWDCTAGINEANAEANTVSVFPNPASNQVNLICSVNAYAVQVTELTGKMVGFYLMQNNKVQFSTENLAKGMYFYNILNDKKTVINRGKFEVAK